MSSKPSLRNALIALVVWVVITIGGGLLQAGGPSGLDGLVTAGAEPSSLEGLVSGGIVWAIPLAALFLLATYRGKWGQLGLVTSGSWRAARPVLIAVAFLLAIAVANGLPATSVLLFLAINSAAVGVSEELAFRGVALRALRGAYPVRRAVLISALAFGAVHSLNAIVTNDISGAVTQSIFAVGMGMWTANIRIRTRSLYLPILLHGLWDLALFIALHGPAGSPLLLVASVSAIIFAVGLGVWGWRSVASASAS